MRTFGVTDVGAVRRDNQDYFHIEQLQGRTVAVLCDGMGGARAGAAASELGCTAFFANLSLALSKQDVPDGDVLLSDAVSYANLRVCDHSRSDKNCEGMGTTMVAAMAEGEVCHIANVGDSRAYHYQNGTLRQITRDHSYVEELVEQGLLRPEEARNHPRKNLITRAVGLNYRLKCDCFTVPFGSGDRVLLCSDGLSNVVEDEAMEQILRREEEPEGACRALLEAALEEGAPDNVTVLILSR